MGIDAFVLCSSFVVIFCSMVYIMAYIERKRAVKKIGVVYPGVSVIVPMWNEEQTIEETLKSLQQVKAHYAGKMEIIVIDDHSTDDSLAIVKAVAAEDKDIRFYLKDANHCRGKSESLNQGIALAAYEIVGCVDADSYPAPDALTCAVEEFRDPRVGAVTTKLIVRKPKKIVEWFQQVEYIFSNFTLMSFDALDSIYITRGPLSLYRKDVMEKISGFLPAGQTPTEDMEITFRIRKAGYSIRASCKARVYTSVMKSWRALFWQRMRWNRGTLINLWMHRDFFFNPKYGMLSMFILPTATLMIFMVGVIISYTAYTFGCVAINAVQKLYYTVYTGYYPDFTQLGEWFSGAGVGNYFLLFIAVMAIYIAVNGVGIKESKEPVSIKYLLFTAVSPLLYNPALIFFWASALVMQTGKRAVRWR